MTWVTFFEFSHAIPTDNHGQPFPGQHQITVAQAPIAMRIPVEFRVARSYRPARRQPPGQRSGQNRPRFHSTHCPEEYARQYDKPEGTAHTSAEGLGKPLCHALCSRSRRPSGRMGQPSRITDGEVGQGSAGCQEKDHRTVHTSR